MATISFGAKVEADTGASSAFEQIGSAQSTITIPSIEVTSVETTHLGQANRAKTFVPALYDAGTCEVECQYSAADLIKIKGLAVDATLHNWKISSPGADQFILFSGFVSKAEGSFSGAEALATIKYSIKVSGQITLDD